MKHRSIFQLTLLMLYLITIEILPGDLPSNHLTPTTKVIHLNFWQIAEDTNPKDSLINIPDSLWQSFEPTYNDNRYNIGNWLIRSSIDVPESLDGKEVYGLFPINLVTAVEFYWDGIKIGQNGKLGSNISDEKAGDFNYSLVIPANLLTQGKHTIVIRLSNYNSNSSWKWFYGDLVIGKYDYILNKLSRLNYQAFFIIGILFIPFLFNLFLYFYRKRKTEHLLFGIICFIVIFDSATSLGPILFDTKTTFVFWQYHAYNTITLLFTILFPAFFIYLFSFPKKIIGLIIIITLVIFFFFTNVENV
ncbi:MAG: hypothetical protein MUF28_04365, partial [Ignavibacterium sp.]|nr:hypothetical protein [Ignavibacterium sp.]